MVYSGKYHENMDDDWEILVGGFNPSEKYEFVSWGYYSQYMESHNPFMFQTTR